MVFYLLMNNSILDEAKWLMMLKYMDFSQGLKALSSGRHSGALALGDYQGRPWNFAAALGETEGSQKFTCFRPHGKQQKLNRSENNLFS